MKIRVYTTDPKDGQVLAGIFDPEKNVLTLSRKRNRHLMRVIPGGAYAMQLDVYERALKRKCLIRIEEVKGGGGSNVYESKIEIWEANGRTGDYGRGKQRFLSLKYMTQILTKAQQEKEAQKQVKWFDEYPCGCSDCKSLRAAGLPVKHP